MATAGISPLEFSSHTHEIGCPEYQPDRGDCAPMLHPAWRRVDYQCLQCDEGWLGSVGPADCPHCGCRYVLWLNR
jgi:hypothetical protein